MDQLHLLRQGGLSRLACAKEQELVDRGQLLPNKDGDEASNQGNKGGNTYHF